MCHTRFFYAVFSSPPHLKVRYALILYNICNTLLSFQLKDFSPSPYADDHSLPALSDIKKIYRNGGLRDYLQKFSFEVHEDKDNTKTYEKLESWKIQEALSNFSLDLLNRVESETESVSLQKEIHNIENAYKYVMERFLQKMEQFLSSCRELRAELQDAGVNFHAASRVTAEVTLVSSTIEMALLLGNAARKLLQLEWNPKFLLYETLAGSVSVATALIALSYMKWSSAKITRDVSEETHFLMDIVMLYRKGNWIDEDVVNLFPHGIDLKLLEEDDSNNGIFQCLGSWRHKLCYAIILTNTQKDAKLLVDDNFLRKVKMFVRSQAAEMWWNR